MEEKSPGRSVSNRTTIARVTIPITVAIAYPLISRPKLSLGFFQYPVEASQ